MYKETQRGSDQLFTQREHSLAIHHFHIHLACILFTPNFSWVLHFLSQEKSKTTVMQNFRKLTRCVHGLSENGDL